LSDIFASFAKLNKKSKKMDLFAQIKKEIEIKENGVVAEIMKKSGFNYEQIFGVSINELKQIAQKYYPNSELADKLRKTNIREYLLMADMLENKEKLSPEKALEIVSQIPNNEIAEQICLNMLIDIEFSTEIWTKWIKSQNKFVKITGYLLASNLFKRKRKPDDEFIENALFYIENENSFNDYFITKSITRFLRDLALNYPDFYEAVSSITTGLSERNDKYSGLLKEEVTAFL